MRSQVIDRDRAFSQVIDRGPAFSQVIDRGPAYSQVIDRTRLPRYEKGGVVGKTGPAVVHKGEKIIPANKKKKAAFAFLKGLQGK